MSRVSRWSRLLTVLFAACQVALPASLSIGDGVVSDDGRAASSHVEDATRGACKSPHAGDCIICRQLSAPVGSAPAGPVDVPRVLRGELAGPVRVSAALLQRQGFQSRAPPAWNA